LITCLQFVQLYSTDKFLTQHRSFVLFLVYLQYTDNLPFERMAKEILQAVKCVIVCLFVCCCLCCVPRFFSRSEQRDIDCVDYCAIKQTHVIFRCHLSHRKHASGKPCLIEMIIFHTIFNSFNSLSHNNICFPFMHCFSTLSSNEQRNLAERIWKRRAGDTIQ
jgi:hypothetical protein